MTNSLGDGAGFPHRMFSLNIILDFTFSFLGHVNAWKSKWMDSIN